MWACTNCGSKNVEILEWADPNSGEVRGDFDSASKLQHELKCNNCASFGTVTWEERDEYSIYTLDHASMVEISPGQDENNVIKCEDVNYEDLMAHGDEVVSANDFLELLKWFAEHINESDCFETQDKYFIVDNDSKEVVH